MTSSDLRAHLDQAAKFADSIQPRAGEVLLLTGSSVLPFDTGGGDLDLVLITPDDGRVADFAARRHSERESEQLANGYVMSYADLNGREADVEVWPTERVVRTASALDLGIRDVVAVEADFTRVGGLDVKVGTDLLHALRCGVAVHGAQRLGELRAMVPWTSYQAFKRDCLLINVRDAARGVHASLLAGRPDEAYLKLCWAADSLVDAMIFHFGFSISRWKWRLRYLPLLEPWIGDWYRQVRFTTEPCAAELAGHIEVLRDTWQRFAGTVPVAATPAAS